MPNRIIKESSRTSTTLDALSDGAERMFWRLTTVADDYGRFDANPNILLATCFPLRVTSLKIKQILKWYHELEVCQLVQSYDCNGKHLGFFATWDKHQQIRAKASKFPDPTPASICNHLQSNVPESEIESEIEKREARSENGHAQSIGSASTPKGFAEFWIKYPKKKNKGDAEKAWKAAHVDDVLLAEIIEAIETARRSPDWLKDNGQFIPYPASWLRAKGWEDEHSKAPTNSQWKDQLRERLRQREEAESGRGNHH